MADCPFQMVNGSHASLEFFDFGLVFHVHSPDSCYFKANRKPRWRRGFCRSLRCSGRQGALRNEGTLVVSARQTKNQVINSPTTKSCPDGSSIFKNRPAKDRLSSSGVSSSSDASTYSQRALARTQVLERRSSSKIRRTARAVASTDTILALCEDAMPSPSGVKTRNNESSVFQRSKTAKATSSELMFMTLSYHLGFESAEWLCRKLKIDIGVNQAIIDAMTPE